MKYGSQAKNRLDRQTREFHELLLPQVLAYLHAEPVTTVIDLGCGAGRFTEILSRGGFSTIGVDRSALQIKVAQARADESNSGARYFCANFDEFEVGAGTFDAALLIYVLLDCTSSSDVNKIIATASRMLKPGGCLIIGECHPHNIDRPNDIEVVQFTDDARYGELGSSTESQVALVSGEWITFKPNHHYSLQFIFRTLRAHGFIVEDICELSVESKFPTHLVVQARYAALTLKQSIVNS